MKPIDCTKERLPFGGDGRIACTPSDNLPDAVTTEYQGRVTLIYLDPPFCTGQLFSAGTRESGRTLAYSDRLDFSEYMRLMRDVLTKCRTLLSADGSLYLHIDYRMSAHLRLLLDEIFGAEHFMNEIIWSYRSGGRAKSHFPRKHDTIFLYSKSNKPYFNLETLGKPRGALRRNNMKRDIDSDGRVFYSIRTAGKLYKYYEDDPVYPSDVWDDIEHLHQRDKERVNYPTQKPEALLTRIVKASSREGDIICDLFSGSGVTAAVAHKTGRKWLASDLSPVAVATLRMRLIRDSKCAEGNGALFEYDKSSDEIIKHIQIKSDVSDSERRVTVISDGLKLTQMSLGHIRDGVFYPETFAVNMNGTDRITVEGTREHTALHIFTKDGERVLMELEQN